MRTIIIVDGGNLYRRLKELGLKVDYSHLISHLCDQRELISKTLYVGKVRADRQYLRPKI